MSESPITFNVNIDTANTIQEVRNTFPNTIHSIDTTLDSIISLTGFPFAFAKEYANHCLEKTKYKLAEKLSRIKSEKIVPPPVHIAAPVLQACCYTANCEELHNMFASLLATSMNEEFQDIAHPAFVEVIKQLSPHEARIISRESQGDLSILPMCTLRAQTPTSLIRGVSMPFNAPFDFPREGISIVENVILFNAIDYTSVTIGNLNSYSSTSENLFRLRIFSPSDRHLKDVNAYTPFRHIFSAYLDSPYEQEQLEPGQQYALIPKLTQLTSFGAQFIQACVLEDNTLESQ